MTIVGAGSSGWGFQITPVGLGVRTVIMEYCMEIFQKTKKNGWCGNSSFRIYSNVLNLSNEEIHELSGSMQHAFQ